MKSFYFSKGRVAFKNGLLMLGFKKGDQLLMPKLICNVITEELDILGIKPVFYDIDKNFKPIWQNIEKKFNNKIKGLMMIHFFGRPQNITNFKKYCIKKKIFLIEDNCHGFNGVENFKLSGDIGISSPYKILEEINNGGILFIKNKKFYQNHTIKDYSQNNSSFIKKIFKLIKNIKLLRILYRKLIFRPDYEDISIATNKNDLNNIYLNKEDIKITSNFSFNKEKEKRSYSFNLWKKKLEKFKIYPYFNYDKKDDYILWYFVAKINDYKKRKKIYDWGWRNDIDIVSWPSFPSNFSKKSKIFKFSRNFVLFPLNIKSKDEIKKFKIKSL